MVQPMLQMLSILLALCLPVFIICLVVYLLGRVAVHKQLGRLLRRSALIWAPILWSIFTFLIVNTSTCDGDPLYGFRNCSVFPDGLANFSFIFFALGIVFGLIYLALLVVIGGFVEWRARRERAGHMDK